MTYPPITALLAHRSPMLLIDAVVSHTAELTCCSAVLRRDCVFCRDGSLPGVVMIELMAQAAAASAALRRPGDAAAARQGVLVTTRKLELRVPTLPLDAELRVCAATLFADAGMGQFSCEVGCGKDILGVARLTVFEPPSGTEQLGDKRHVS